MKTASGLVTLSVVLIAAGGAAAASAERDDDRRASRKHVVASFESTWKDSVKSVRLETMEDFDDDDDRDGSSRKHGAKRKHRGASFEPTWKDSVNGLHFGKRGDDDDDDRGWSNRKHGRKGRPLDLDDYHRLPAGPPVDLPDRGGQSSPVPEPVSGLLLGAGALVVGYAVRKPLKSND